MSCKWHIGEDSGIKVNESSEVVAIQVRVLFLLQIHQIWETWFRWVWADDLVNIVCVICSKSKVLLFDEPRTKCMDINEYGSYSDINACSFITFIEILFYFVELLKKHGKLLLSVCMLLLLHLKVKTKQCEVNGDIRHTIAWNGH